MTIRGLISGPSALAVLVLLTLRAAFADPAIGGAAMSANDTIIENVSNAKVYTTLLAALKAAGLIDRLERTGPYTVFAPTNAAFDALPSGTAQSLLKPANKAKLKRILSYNIVTGRLDTEILDQFIKDGGGKAELTTLEGGTLTVTGNGEDLTITGAKGDAAKIVTPDVYQSNGVIMVTDTLLMPPESVRDRSKTSPR